MIGRLALGAALLMGLLGSAVAADLPTHKAAEPPPPPTFSWTGFYLGGFLGGAWSDPVKTPDAITQGSFTAFGFTFPRGTPDLCAVGAALGTGCIAKYRLNTSVTGGATGGYNWQFGKLVTGFEGEFGYMRLSGSGVVPFQYGGVPCGSAALPCGERASTTAGNAYGVLEARLGVTGDIFNPAWTWGDHTLFYVKGGAAVTRLTTSLTCSGEPVRAGGCLPFAFSDARDVWGPAVGGGVEWAITDHWSVKGEYEYLGFTSPTKTCGTVPIGATGAGVAVCTESHLDGVQTAKLGVNYHF